MCLYYKGSTLQVNSVHNKILIRLGAHSMGVNSDRLRSVMDCSNRIVVPIDSSCEVHSSGYITFTSTQDVI